MYLDDADVGDTKLLNTSWKAVRRTRRPAVHSVHQAWEVGLREEGTTGTMSVKYMCVTGWKNSVNILWRTATQNGTGMYGG